MSFPSNRRRLLLTAWSAALAAPLRAQNGGSRADPIAPPDAPPVRDTFFGVTVEDPYRHLEAVDDPAVAAWMRAQAERTRRTLDAIGPRAEWVRFFHRIDAATPARVASVVRGANDRWFYLKRAVGANQFALTWRDGLDGAEHRLVDPDALSGPGQAPLAINWFAPSPSGRLVAYGLSRGGSEDAVLHLIDTRTGRAVGRPIDRTPFAGVSWDGDGTLYFNRLRALPRGAPATEKYLRSAVVRLNVGQPEPHPVPVLDEARAGVSLLPAETPYVSITHDGRWALGWLIHGVQRELRLLVAPAASVRSGRPAWRPLLDRADAVTHADYHDDTLYLLSHRGAPRSQLWALPLRAAGFGEARLRIAESERVLTGLGAASDAVYVEAREGNHKRLLRLGYDEAGPRALDLPFDGAFTLSGEDGAGATDGRLPGAVISLQGWTQATRVLAIDAQGRARDTGLQPLGPHDSADDVQTEEILVDTDDGQRVPMSIIHRRGLPRDGERPTLLQGYAAYGETEEPYYSVFRLAWLQAGGVHAIANPRGSGVYGEPWYRAGFQSTKPNSWKDFIACARHLVSCGLTRPGRLAIQGGSAGGILVGRAMTERPDLFAAVVAAVGALDMLRAEDTPNGVPNIPEFGSKTTQAGFQALLAMSTYHQIRDGTAYPGVMLTHGVNDPRVEVWHSTKTAARLARATTSGRPVLLRLDYDAGHGIGNTKAQVEQERADLLAFLLWQLGEPGYQPDADLIRSR